MPRHNRVLLFCGHHRLRVPCPPRARRYISPSMSVAYPCADSVGTSHVKATRLSRATSRKAAEIISRAVMCSWSWPKGARRPNPGDSHVQCLPKNRRCLRGVYGDTGKRQGAPITETPNSARPSAHARPPAQDPIPSNDDPRRFWPSTPPRQPFWSSQDHGIRDRSDRPSACAS
jgi:hypothetical protein